MTKMRLKKSRTNASLFFIFYTNKERTNNLKDKLEEGGKTQNIAMRNKEMTNMKRKEKKDKE